MNPNSAILDQQFLEPVAEVAGLKLQPFSPGILTACRKLDFKIVTGTPEEKKALAPAESQFQLMALLWMLANERDTVLKLVAGPSEEFCAAIERFEFLIPISEIGKAAEAIAKIVEQANVSAVETLPKPQPDAGDAPQPPPN